MDEDRPASTSGDRRSSATHRSSRHVSVRQSRVSTALKLGVSASLLSYVFAKVGWEEFLGVLHRADGVYIALSFALSPVLILASVLKWRVFLRAKGIEAPRLQLFALYLVGNFFNHLLPSNVGGDAIRSFRLGRLTGQLDEALASVFMERISGLTVLLLLLLIALGFAPQLLDDPPVAAGVVIAGSGYAALVWLALDPRPVHQLRAYWRAPGLAQIVAKAEKVHGAIGAYRHHADIWPSVLGLSLLFYALAILNVYVSCLAFGARPSMLAVAAGVPVILVISMIPISLGGVGLSEWAYFAVFEHLGIPGSLGLSVALLLRLKALVVGCAGGGLYAKSLMKGAKRDDYAPA